MEVGVGLGNIVGEEHSLGKSEVHFNVLKSYNFGQLGLDFSTGGNFIPGTRDMMEGNTEVLSAADSKFGSVSMVYRLPIKKYFFIEPRAGYASLHSFVHTDDKTKISQSNFTAGIGVGGTINKLSLSLRYQYFGLTADYEGVKNGIILKSNAEPVAVVLLRVSYRFSLDKFFRNKNVNPD